MTDAMMNLRSLVEKSAAADLLREKSGFAADEKPMAPKRTISRMATTQESGMNGMKILRRNGEKEPQLSCPEQPLATFIACQDEYIPLHKPGGAYTSSGLSSLAGK